MDGVTLTFHLAGINNQNFLMRDQETGTYWQQISGRAVSGPLTGRQLALELAGTRPDMKVLYLSGYTENAAIQTGIVDASVAFLPKPFSRDALAKMIRSVLEAR